MHKLNKVVNNGNLHIKIDPKQDNVIQIFENDPVYC